LELFLFDPAKQRQKVGALSGGERARVALAKVLREGANLLVFDEPTNDLDLPTLAALEGMLEAFAGSVLVVTHDRAFLDRVATAILAFEAAPSGAASGGPSTVTRYAGGYQDYIAQRPDRQAIPRSAPPAAVPSTTAKSKVKSALSHAERIELETIVEAIDAAERRVAQVEALLSDPSVYASQGARVAGLRAELDAARSEVATLVARWEGLERKKGG
jgi:ATP-binding cassette subfamily F protein uup